MPRSPAEGDLHDRSPIGPERLLITALVALLSYAWAHLPDDFALPPGTALCIDARTVRATITAAGVGSSMAAEAKVVATTTSGIDRVLAAFERERWYADSCAESDSYLRIDLTGRLLDPERYRGFDPATYSLTWSVRVAPYTALEAPRTDADAVLLALSGSSLHSEERSDETVAQRLASEALPLATEVVHAAVLAGDGGPASPNRLRGGVATAVLAVLMMGVAAMRRRSVQRRGRSDAHATHDPTHG